MKRIYFVLFFVLLIAFSAIAQTRFQVLIRDSITHEPLVGASFQIKQLQIGEISDLNGIVKLRVTQPGSYNGEANYIGYRKKSLIFHLPQIDTLFIDLSSLENTLEEVRVTSMRTNSTIENTPTRIEVLGLEEVSEENGIKPGNIMSLLGDVAGIQMQQVSAASGNTYARIQGLNGRYTQILKDGLPLFGGMSGGFSIMQIPPLDLKQIEIIKGCGSTLYGADAIGGIINLVSKSPSEKQELAVTLNQTTLAENNLNLYLAKRYKKFGYTLFVGNTYQHQSDVDNDGLTDVPKVNSFLIHPKFVFDFSSKSTMTVNYSGTFDRRVGGENTYFGAIGSEALFHIDNRSQRHSADVKWKYLLNDHSDITLKASNSYLNNNLATNSYQLDAQQDIYYSELSYFVQKKRSNWVVGVNFNGDRFENRSPHLPQLQNYNYHTLGLFAQNSWSVTNKLTIETGFREDYHSDFGFFALPRISFMYKLNSELTARVNGGLGYKVPVSLSYIDPETDLQKPITTNLKAELSQGINADINYRHFFGDKFDVTLNQSFFVTRISNPVMDSSSIASRIALLNAGQPLVTNGWQTYLRLNYDEFEFYLGYVYTHVVEKYEQLYKTPVATPTHNLSGTLFYAINDHLRAGLESSFIAGQVDENHLKTPDYCLMAAMIGYNIGHFSFVLNGENLLDFRQSHYGPIFSGTTTNPIFHKLWAPIDGRVVNFSVKWEI